MCRAFGTGTLLAMQFSENFPRELHAGRTGNDSGGSGSHSRAFLSGIWEPRGNARPTQCVLRKMELIRTVRFSFPSTVAAWSDIICLRLLACWGRGFESHSRNGCSRNYSVCVVLCVGRCLAKGGSQAQGVLPTVYRIKKLKKRQRPNWSAVKPVTIIFTLFTIMDY
jgi:hypothetical protein